MQERGHSCPLILLFGELLVVQEELKIRFQAAAATMRGRLGEIRASYKHRGNSGSNVEQVLRDFLKEYLPRRFDIGHGEIVDRKGNRSKQEDVVIANEHHPYTFSPEAPGLFFIEGVSGVGEVKTVLTTEELRKTFVAARSYKRLTSILPAGALSSSTQRFLIKPPFFLFAFESQITYSKILENTRLFAADDKSKGPSIDGIFVLDRGYLVDLGSGKDGFVIQNPTTKEFYTGWTGQQTDEVLFHFLAWLSNVMPTFSGGTPILGHYLVPNIFK